MASVPSRSTRPSRAGRRWVGGSWLDPLELDDPGPGVGIPVAAGRVPQLGEGIESRGHRDEFVHRAGKALFADLADGDVLQLFYAHIGDFQQDAAGPARHVNARTPSALVLQAFGLRLPVGLIRNLPQTIIPDTAAAL
ncbi:hypothetical protein D3C78_1067050 [compost metagenome]